MSNEISIEVELEFATFSVEFSIIEGQAQRVSDWDGGTPEIGTSVQILCVWVPGCFEDTNLLRYLSRPTLKLLEEAAYEYIGH